jgi:hypothetical protein
MKVAEALSRLDALDGSRVEIDGFLVEIRFQCYVAPDSSTWDRSDQAILLRDQGAVKKLNEIVPGWVGGPGYQDDVMVAGVIHRSTTGPFPASLDEVSSLILKRDDQVYRVL